MAEDNLDGGIEIPISVYSDEQATKKEAEKISNIVKSVLGKKDIINLKGITNQTGKTLVKYSKQVKAIFQQAREEVVLANRRIKNDKQFNKRVDEQKTKNNQSLLFAETLGQNLRGDEKLRASVNAKQVELDNLQKIYNIYAQSNRLETTQGQELMSTIAQTNKELVEMKGHLKDTQKVGGFQKIINTFKRIGIYRVARNLFRVIEQGLSSGISSLRNYDSSFNDTMLKMESSFQIMNESFALIFSSVFEAIEPVISSIATTVAQIANTVSKTVASLKGATTYTAINADYMKSMSDSANSTLLSFDKFESLDAQESSYTTESLTDGDSALTDSELLTTISSIWQNILDLINNIIDVIKSLEPLIKPIVDLVLTVVDVVLEIANAIIDYIEPAIEWVSNVVGPLIQGISDGIKVVVALFKGDFSGAIEYIKDLWINTFKAIGNFFVGIINTLIGDFEDFINGIISGINWVIKGINKIGSWFGNDSLVNEISKISLDRISYFAEGGLVDSGSLFVAGESGAELVTTMPSGQTGVTNIAQFKQAMVEALYECSDLFQGGENSVVLNLDGAEVARSKRFTSEMNRKNAGLNLR